MSTFAESKDNANLDVDNCCNADSDNNGDAERFRKHVSERVKLYEANTKASTTPVHFRSHNNIRHVVPVGILTVLFTLYLTSAALQYNFFNNQPTVNAKAQEIRITTDNQHSDTQLLESRSLETTKHAGVLENLLEYKDLCTKLEVFTKEHVYSSQQANEEKAERQQSDEKSSMDECSAIDNGNDVNGKRGANNKNTGDNSEPSQPNQLDAKYTKLVNHNGPRHSNRAVKGKDKKTKLENNQNNQSENNQKVQPAVKKASTAEPIIYLFALVFIYLLLKAASDINQHYKSQNKGDKRLRRCSLQSYAQTHKQDRRASKGISTKNLPKFYMNKN